jgi:cytoskeletal protein CcmA (bactofilin family)
MADSPHRRTTDRTSTTPTLVGAGTVLTGNLKCEGDLVVGGEVVGDAVVRGSVTLSEGGRWEGKLEASNALIAGETKGALHIAGKLEIRKTARIGGFVQARTIAVAQGAVIDGEMSVTSGAPVVTYKEKRKT